MPCSLCLYADSNRGRREICSFDLVRDGSSVRPLLLPSFVATITTASVSPTTPPTATTTRQPTKYDQSSCLYMEISLHFPLFSLVSVSIKQFLAFSGVDQKLISYFDILLTKYEITGLKLVFGNFLFHSLQYNFAKTISKKVFQTLNCFARKGIIISIELKLYNKQIYLHMLNSTIRFFVCSKAVAIYCRRKLFERRQSI